MLLIMTQILIFKNSQGLQTKQNKHPQAKHKR